MRVWFALAFGLLVGVSTSLAAKAEEVDAADVSHYVWRAARDGGGALIQNVFGGEYRYTAVPAAADGRVEGRFSLGKPARSEYTLFSAEEEEALWTLHEQQRHRDEPPPRASRRGAFRLLSPTPALPKLNWPKVVELEDRVCVPTAAFADSPDWRSHLTCWIKGAQRVE